MITALFTVPTAGSEKSSLTKFVTGILSTIAAASAFAFILSECSATTTVNVRTSETSSIVAVAVSVTVISSVPHVTDATPVSLSIEIILSSELSHVITELLGVPLIGSDLKYTLE